MFYSFFKRAFDVAVSLIIMVFGAPFLLVLGSFVFLFIGSQIFFFQTRPGKDGKPFEMIKFRTMSNSLDSEGQILPDHMRLTKFGKLIRAASLDELPALVNVLRGEMSLVGPRPLLMEYLPLYSTEQFHRHDVLPGITGWAQVNGRNSLSWEEKFKLDIWYVENKSFYLDLKILFITLIKVLKRDGINHADSVSMPKFVGVNSDE